MLALCREGSMRVLAEDGEEKLTMKASFSQ